MSSLNGGNMILKRVTLLAAVCGALKTTVGLWNFVAEYVLAASARAGQVPVMYTVGWLTEILFHASLAVFLFVLVKRQHS